ncbi:MAG: hypothetical protein Q9220_001617 [cf. Caloplaca sp. 1 TL-2023]
MASTVPPPDTYVPMGATITSPEPSYFNLPTANQRRHQNPSTTSLTGPTPLPEGTDTQTYDPTSTDPFSPFYCHTRASESRSRVFHSSHNDHDLEKGIPAYTITSHNADKSTHSLPFDASGQKKCNNNKGQSLLCKSEAKQRGGWWRNLSRRQKMCVHVLVAVVFVGAVTGLGVGVSKSMGTGVWKNADGASAGIGKEG